MKEDMQMTQSPYGKVCSLISIREIKINSHSELSLHTHKTGWNFENRVTSVGEDAQQLKLSGECKLVLPLWKQFGHVY